MYKIYINKTPIFLCSTEEGEAMLPGDDKNLVTHYWGKPSLLLNYIDMLEKTKRFASVTIIASDLEKLRSDFWSLFRIVEAAGGVVFNKNKEILLIFRRGNWDLPKGKIDPGETTEKAALREVMEETGLRDVRLKRPFCTTYHIYQGMEKKRILKPVYWYKMRSDDKNLRPQKSEDIDKAVWENVDSFMKKNLPTFHSVMDVLQLVVDEKRSKESEGDQTGAPPKKALK